MQQAILDIEVYQNYFLIMFMRLSDNKPIAFEQYDGKELDIPEVKKILSKYEIVTFNGNKYDILLVQLALKGTSCAILKQASNDIIDNQFTKFQFDQKYMINKDLLINHVDIIELCIGKSSLKMYGARLHCEKLQDLPIEPSAMISKEQRELLKKYCYNDLKVTQIVLNQVTPQLNLRRQMSKQYWTDLRSKSDAQIAEEVIKNEIRKKTGTVPTKIELEERSFKYEIPEFINVQNNKILDILNNKSFTISHTGKIEMPKELAEMKIKIGKSVYQMGIGGLHSTEKSVNYKEDSTFFISDWDVTSYYPSIILNCGLYPQQLGKSFLDIYQEIVSERIYAKNQGNKLKADTLKIVINGSFGKLGSMYSILYSPKLMIQVTITGQLALLMLISELEEQGIKVISANTDGIVIRCQWNKEKQLINIINNWEKQTQFSMERTDYKALYSRDVNNYIAVKPTNEVKTKGCFSAANIGKNPQNEICNMAVIEYLINNTPFIETLKKSTDITKFITVRQVKGGAVKGSEYLGKTIRWYYAKNIKGTINYKDSGNTVPRSVGAKPCMELPKQFPNDIDYQWYENECKQLMNDIGIHSIGQISLF